MIEVKHLTKRYGNHTAVSDLSFTIEKGQIYGFLGPRQITQIRELIRTLGKDHTVILSSHILSEVQAVCQTILILSKGRLAACDTPKNLEKWFAGTHSLELTAEAIWISSGALVDEQTSAQVSGGNQDLFLNGLNYLCGGADSSITIHAKSLDQQTLTLDSGTASVLTVLVIGIVPMAYGGCGKDADKVVIFLGICWKISINILLI